jgi:hypothetical protein
VDKDSSSQKSSAFEQLESESFQKIPAFGAGLRLDV